MANLRPSPLISDPVTWRTAAVCINDERSSFSTESGGAKPDADEENDKLLDLITVEDD